MRAVIQRVDSASVSVGDQEVGRINQGLLAFVGIGKEDDNTDLEYMQSKIINLRIFPDGEKETALSLKEIGGELLLVSQFTLYGDVRKGRRPSFSDAMLPENAKKMFEELVRLCHNEGLQVRTGVFGAMMKVDLVNNGPYTILIDSKKSF